ncbi:hypothetical protein DPMN_084073 [Dreissena polymorpha]|uniref:Uncharacterized protein n=1 Tax=Dreissena polymorpha TaxID=45954 RepID=A0A9D3YB36_DREPO|nr:hypothetical protein DPMN_084073 [Dreissena polymorpha]
MYRFSGHIQLSVYLNHGLVTVYVIQGRHLNSGSQLRPDTYVMISLIPDDDGVTPTRCRNQRSEELQQPDI